MTAFPDFTSRAAWLDEDNIDTDTIYPARFLMVLDRDGLGEHLFRDRRFGKDGAPDPGFILNQNALNGSSVLIAGKNFGCGSSREHAVWALSSYGIRCVIARGFSEIFYANCMRNGVLPVIAGEREHDMAMSDARSLAPFTISLETKSIASPSGTWTFRIDDMDRETLLNGWDESERILNFHRGDIRAFEARHKQRQPWLFF